MNPSPYEIGRNTGNNLGSVFQDFHDNRAIDKILKNTYEGNQEDSLTRGLSDILNQVSPQNRQAAMQLFQQKQKSAQDRMQRQNQQEAFQSQGLDPSLASLDPSVQNQFIKNQTGGGNVNPKAQEWAYKELEKKAPIDALKSSLSELRNLNSKGATGPIAGRVPQGLASDKSNAIRKAIDANAIQILNVHKSMFPRGLTQGEFKTLSEKLVSSKNTQEANNAILDAYDKLANLQDRKLKAVEEATQKFGFDPMLPFLVSGIQKEFDEEESSVNRGLYEFVTGNNPKKSEEEVKVTESSPSKKMSLEEIFR